MKNKRIYLYILILIIYILFFSGNNCNDFYKEDKCLSNKLDKFITFSQSTSSNILIDQIIEFDLVLMGKKMYLVTLCTEDDYLPIQFKIIDKYKNKVIYNNKYDDYDNAIGFKLKDHRSLTITAEVIPRNNRRELRQNPTCIGLYIQYK